MSKDQVNVTLFDEFMRLRERVAELQELVRWCLQHGVMAGQVWDCRTETFVDGIRASGCVFGDPIDVPEKFAPLIAESKKHE